MIHSRAKYAGSILVFCISLVHSQAQPNPIFYDVTEKSGIDFKYTFGDNSYQNIMESSGAGISILDYNLDGYPDIYMLNGTYLEGISDASGKAYRKASNKLYRNNGDGTFTDVSELAGVANKQWSMAAGVYDYDADGDPDIYLSNYGPNVFYLNDGDGTFTNVTDKLGLAGPAELNGFPKWSVSVAYLDYNQDKRTDIMIGNFLAFDPSIKSVPDPSVMPHPGDYLGQASLLYRQQADGSFLEVTSDAGLLFPDSKCMGLTVFDVDEDGDLDLLQSNDHQPNFLFRNQHGKFQEVGISSGVAVNSDGQATGSMHGTLGDVNGDGLIDILVTDLKYGSLYQNIGKGIFKDITFISGIATHFRGKGGWAASLADFDNDGDLDIFSANGTAEELILQLPLLLENTGEGKFVNSGPEWGQYFREKHSGRGAAVVDFDNDGDLDVVVSHVEPGSSATLLENAMQNNNHWLGLTLLAPGDGSLTVGARITVSTGDRKQIRIHQPSTGYLSYSDPRIHFGLGTHQQVDQVEILWPDGAREILKNVSIDQYLSVRKGQGIVPDHMDK
jgi:hypothetical protein